MGFPLEEHRQHFSEKLNYTLAKPQDKYATVPVAITVTATLSLLFLLLWLLLLLFLSLLLFLCRIA